MDDSDIADLSTETVEDQFGKVKKSSNHSHEMEYGTHDLDSEPLGNFQAGGGSFSPLAPPAPPSPPTTKDHVVNAREVEVHQAYWDVMDAKTASERKIAEQELSQVLAMRRLADQKFGAIAVAAAKGDTTKADSLLEDPVAQITNVSCHQKALQVVVMKCGPFTDYSMRYSGLFANLCDRRMDQQAINAAIEKGCDAPVVV